MIIEVRNPAVFEIGVMRDLMDKAFPTGTLASGGFAENKEGFIAKVLDPDYALLVATEDNMPVGVALVLVPPPGTDVYAQVLNFYNTGSSKARGDLVDAVVEITRAKGHMKVWAINQTDRPDSVWARMFQRAGDASKVGSIMEVTFK